MSIGLLKDINSILDYHKNELRVLSPSAQHDLQEIINAVKNELAMTGGVKKTNGQAGPGMMPKKIPVTTKKTRTRKKSTK